MKNILIFSVFTFLILSLTSCGARCPLGSEWDPTTGQCIQVVGGGGTVGGTGNAGQTGSFTTTQAYADLNSNGYADLAPGNTMGSHKTDMLYRAVRMDLYGFGFNAETYGLMHKTLVDKVNIQIFWNAAKNLWTNQSGQRIIFEYSYNSFQLGNFAVDPVYTNVCYPDQLTGCIYVKEQRCSGIVIQYHITGYKVSQ